MEKNYHTIAYKKQLRIDIIMKRSEIIGLKHKLEKIEKEMNSEEFCVENYVSLSNKKNDISDQLQKAEGELKQMENKLSTLIK